MAKINLKRGLTDIVLYLIIFIVVQIIVMYAGVGIWAGIKGEGYQATLLAISSGSNPILTALTSAFSNVITLVIFLKTKWTPLTRDYLLSKPWATLLWVALFTLGTIIPLGFIYEQIGIEMDENTEQIFASLMKEPWGYVAIGVLAPFAEEVVFRGAVLRTLLGLMSKKNHWVAIMISRQRSAVCQCPPDGLAPGVDVLSHQESCSGHPAPLGEQYDGVCSIQYHASERWQTHRPLPWR